jgi:predicted HicB family RNase H-like nuclease
MKGILANYIEEEKNEHVQVHVRIPEELHRKVIAIKEKENVTSLNKMVEASFKLLVEFYEKKGGKV